MIWRIISCVTCIFDIFFFENLSNVTKRSLSVFKRSDLVFIDSFYFLLFFSQFIDFFYFIKNVNFVTSCLSLLLIILLSEFYRKKVNAGLENAFHNSILSTFFARHK